VISVIYKCALNGLIDFNVERFCEAGSVKFLTTFVGRVLPLSGKRVHNSRAGMLASGSERIVEYWNDEKQKMSLARFAETQ